MVAALDQYREALDLLGPTAPAAERQRLEGLQTTLHREQAVLQAFADRVTEDYDAVFVAAVQRAIADVDGEVEECRRQELEPMRPPTDGTVEPPARRPQCESKDLNGVLAGVVDADRVLATALDEIVGREWPTITIPAEPQAPIGRGERWLRVRDLMSAAANGPLYTIDRAAADARARIAATL
ncbi:MAG: hypothetical protein KC656_15080, partial [Myxococcales bacterium]|nr:hypothetical protein [Myxococcales bacterium]